MYRWLVACLVSSVLVLALVLGRSRDPEPDRQPPARSAGTSPAAPARPGGAAPAAVAARPPRGIPPQAPSPPAAAARRPPEAPSDEERVERERIAKERFDGAVEGGGYSAEMIDRRVVGLFETVELEPVLGRAGRIRGLEIRGLAPDSPLAPAGFSEGDRITRINGARLRDPADLPRLLVRLRPPIEICAERGHERFCAELLAN